LTTSFIEAEVLRACQTLFGTETHISRSFLLSLRPDGLKAAYRKKAKETHPDFFACEAPNVQKEQASRFRDVAEAYDVVNRYFEKREKRSCAASTPVHAYRSQREQNKNAGDPVNNVYGPAGFSVDRSLPIHSLQFGQYLYYRGFISYRALIDALVWQRKQRPIIGDIARRWGWLNNEAIERIIRARGLRGHFGEKALALDLLTSFQVKALLFFQRSRQRRLGTYFVQHNSMKPEKLERLVQQLHEYNSRFRDEPLRIKRSRSAHV
jgi:curved DNA-binding protein CbpA